MSRFNRRFQSLRFEDAAGVGLTVGPGPGDVSIDGMTAENVDAVRAMDRGQFDGHVLTDDLEQSLSLTVEMADVSLTSASQARVLDFIMRKGTFAALQTTNPNADIWSWKAIMTFSKGAVTSTLTLPCVRGQVGIAEGVEATTIPFTGTNNGSPVFA